MTKNPIKNNDRSFNSIDHYLRHVERQPALSLRFAGAVASGHADEDDRNRHFKIALDCLKLMEIDRSMSGPCTATADLLALAGSDCEKLTPLLGPVFDRIEKTFHYNSRSGIQTFEAVFCHCVAQDALAETAIERGLDLALHVGGQGLQADILEIMNNHAPLPVESIVAERFARTTLPDAERSDPVWFRIVGLDERPVIKIKSFDELGPAFAKARVLGCETNALCYSFTARAPDRLAKNLALYNTDAALIESARDTMQRLDDVIGGRMTLTDAAHAMNATLYGRAKPDAMPTSDATVLVIVVDGQALAAAPHTGLSLGL